MAIFKKLAIIQQKLIAPKGQTNTFGKFNYRSCEDIIHALKPLLDEQKCLVYMTNDMEMVGDRIYVKAKATLIDVESGETLESVAHAREEVEKKGMDGSQITGASSSYARKYALAGLFMIDNEKDSDATSEKTKEDKPKAEKPKVMPITPEQKAQILHEINRTHIALNEVCGRYHVDSLDDLPMEYFDKLYKNLQKAPTFEG